MKQPVIININQQKGVNYFVNFNLNPKASPIAT